MKTHTPKTQTVRWGDHISTWYTPQVNRKKQIALFLTMGFFIAMPLLDFVSWGVIPRILNKYPLWLYK